MRRIESSLIGRSLELKSRQLVADVVCQGTQTASRTRVFAEVVAGSGRASVEDDAVEAIVSTAASQRPDRIRGIAERSGLDFPNRVRAGGEPVEGIGAVRHSHG